MEKKLPGRVYFVESPKDNTVRVALDVVYNEKQVQWFDTVKERIMGLGKIVDDDSQHFVFERAEDEGGGIYTFVPMTLEIYNNKVKKYLLIPRDCQDEEALLKAFEETKAQAW